MRSVHTIIVHSFQLAMTALVGAKIWYLKHIHSSEHNVIQQSCIDPVHHHLRCVQLFRRARYSTVGIGERAPIVNFSTGLAIRGDLTCMTTSNTSIPTTSIPPHL